MRRMLAFRVPTTFDPDLTSSRSRHDARVGSGLAGNLVTNNSQNTICYEERLIHHQERALHDFPT